MKKEHILIVLGFMIILVPLIYPGGIRAANDPRFFGTYCGEARYTENYTVEVRFLGILISRRTMSRTYTIENVKVHLEYRESSRTGLVYGRGSGSYEGKTIPFVIAGNVTDRGRVRGYLRVRGEEPYQGEALLNEDGLSLSVNALGGKARSTLSKTGCGNMPPAVTIERPGSEGPFPFGDILHFRARVTDEDPISSFPSQRLIWSARPAGVPFAPVLSLGHGVNIYTTDLPPGNHEITFTAIDGNGLIASATVRIEITNRSPNAPEILSPLNGTSFSDCQTLVFRGQASDPEDGFLPDSALTWDSNRDGALGRGRCMSRTLSRGTHIITLTATDSAGAPARASLTVPVTASSGNCAPTPEIRRPGNLDAVISGSPITFVGRAHDAEEPSGLLRSDRLEWYAEWQADGSSHRTHLGTGAHLEAPAPSVGTDTRVTIILEATDGGGARGEDRITIYVIPMLY